MVQQCSIVEATSNSFHQLGAIQEASDQNHTKNKGVKWILVILKLCNYLMEV